MRRSTWRDLAGLTTFAVFCLLSTALSGELPGTVAEVATNEQIKWQVIAAGGSRGSSTNFGLSGTIGQTATGHGTTVSYSVRHGYWQSFTAPCKCGDADGSGIFTISDAVFLITYIFAGGPVPSPLCLGDADGNSIITISDAVYLITFIFGGGPAPHCPAAD